MISLNGRLAFEGGWGRLELTPEAPISTRAERKEIKKNSSILPHPVSYLLGTDGVKDAQEATLKFLSLGLQTVAYGE